LLLLLGAISILTPFSLDLYLPALPAIAADLKASPGAVIRDRFDVAHTARALSLLGLITGFGPILAPQFVYRSVR
jgi:hypothetical protein